MRQHITAPKAPARLLAGLVAAGCLVPVLAGCAASYPVTSPKAARDGAKPAGAAPVTGRARTGIGAAPGSAAAVAAGKPGAVDCRKAKCVALSFDAGPSQYTPQVLKTLEKYHAHATFMTLGKNHVLKHPDLVRQEAAAGMEIGNHTWTHQILTDIDPAEARKELKLNQDAVKKITGTAPTLMRPPQGRTNEDVTKICRELGLSQVLWSVTAKDYKTRDSAVIKQRVLDQTRRDGIILLHDIYPGTAPALPGILSALDAKGYTVVTVSQLLWPAAPEPGEVYRPDKP
ncbi:polysaccharide deacetylase family protein [Streptomyces fuscigenes]|uniref:polysaccharide deacetylase family protein n=1 Tax=Streptomyces fuscigenes TaxID=1528880 RepID=UPI001F1BF345|nr:polysaccharide deacetylase family protein [Streptomyces fuscigenes]MCF3960736.1 polysaccharide deacetylase family protein [Streptomyces fuscigenes]